MSAQMVIQVAEGQSIDREDALRPTGATRQRRGGSVSGSRSVTSSAVRSCAYGDVDAGVIATRPDSRVAPAVTTGELSLTPRGVMVMMTAIIAVVGVMMVTVITSFLAVSPEASSPAATAMVASVDRAED